MLKKLRLRGFINASLAAGLFAASCADAATVWSVKDNATIHAVISAQQLTRIAVAGDRIVTTRGIQSAYTMTLDDTQGSIFLKPTRRYRKKLFYLFIATEQGRNYLLLCQPKKQRYANMLIIKPQEIQHIQALRWEKTSPYIETLLRLLNDLNQRRIPAGYESIPVGTAPVAVIHQHLKMRLQARYQGAHLRGERWTVTNTSDHVISLEETAFYQAGDRAIQFRDIQLAPHAQTELMKVSVL